MDQDMITDITLDHLPDLSDASISFQIPSSNASADLLLADQTDGFDLLRNVVDDTSFAPVTFLKPRGPPLTLGELTPRVQATPRQIARSPSPTPIQLPCSSAKPRPMARSQSPISIQVPYSSAKPSAIPHRLTLGHRSPDKSAQTPHAKFINRIETPFFSKERLDRLHTEVETLDQAEVESPAHVHVIQAAHGGPIASKSPSRANSNPTDDAPPIPPVSEALDSVTAEKDAHPIIEIPADQDVVMGTETEGPTEAADVAVPMPRAKSKRDPRTRAKFVVAAGGSSKPPVFPTAHVSKKTKKKPSRIREAHQVLPAAARQITSPQPIAINAEGLVPSACMSGDIDPNPDNIPTIGITERLVSFSQSMISSFGLSKPKSEQCLPVIPHNVVRVENPRNGPLPPAAAEPPPLPPRRIKDIPSAHDVEPLRLSEISPHKPPDSPAYSGRLQDGRQHAMSPLRPAKKRASTDGDQLQEHHRRKRGKMMPVDVDLERGSSDEEICQGPVAPRPDQVNDEDHMVTHSETRDNARHSDSLKSTLPSARTKYRPKLKFSSRCKGPILDPFPYLSKSRQVHREINQGNGQRNETQSKTARIASGSLLNRRSARTRLRRENNSSEANTIELSHGRQLSGPTSTVVDLPLIEKKQNATLSVAPLTKPKRGWQQAKPAKAHPLHGISDCKPLRASHQAGVRSHKAGVVPSVPAVPFFFCTEQRAKEREKFDEMVKRKEEEMQKLKEEERRREEEEEERAIRELRRKAVPKANEIPEWYADMPKKKGRRCDTEN
ncbi:hypothetical protein JVU11DRAFT_10951 [Chiua virens]|nr:hypothetical protein JVU11DRAFT_10951 [Chiua virens]